MSIDLLAYKHQPGLANWPDFTGTSLDTFNYFLETVIDLGLDDFTVIGLADKKMHISSSVLYSNASTRELTLEIFKQMNHVIREVQVDVKYEKQVKDRLDQFFTFQLLKAS